MMHKKREISEGTKSSGSWKGMERMLRGQVDPREERNGLVVTGGKGKHRTDRCLQVSEST